MKKATPKVMKLLNPYTGLMECQVCGSQHAANNAPGGRGFYRGSWQCRNGCKLPEREGAPTMRTEALCK